MRALGLFTPPRRLRPAADFIARHSAIIALAIFAIVGAAVFDDYGISSDEVAQRGIGNVLFDYMLRGGEGETSGGRHNRFYGAAFEIPLIAVERLLRLEDSRDIFLIRRLITHLFFLVGGFFAWLLAYRLFGSRLVALIAMLIFLLHPRIYAHSFFNTKDPPFLSMFMIALYLTHRAFRRDTIWAFALCGAGVGLLTNIRVMGIMLFAAVLGMLALDALSELKRDMRSVKRALANSGAFFTAFAATLYATWPLLWRSPLGLAESLSVMSGYPTNVATLFRGEPVRWPNIPWDYIPTWILITTPPLALIIAAVGIAYLARLCAARPRDILANSTARFGLLAVVCLTLPVAAVILLNSNLYNGWRHMYFLYAPICVLAAFGLRALSLIPKPRLRIAVHALAALGLAVIIVQMVRLHPYQNEYFNPLVDKSGLADRWQMGYWHVAYKEALETLLEMQPTGRVAISDPVYLHAERAMLLIPEDDRRRLSISLSFPSFYIISGDARHPEDVVFWRREVYGAPVVSILDARARSETAFRDAYAAARESQPSASAGGFAIYADADGDALIYIKEACEESDTRGTFQLSIFPSHRQDIPKRLRNDGATYESSRFDFWRYGARLDGDCLISVPIPDYPIHAIETEKWVDLSEGVQWKAAIPLAESLGEYAAALSAPHGDPSASAGGFDIYANGDALIYIKEACGESDIRARFLLSVFPVDRSDLPQSVRAAGSDHEPLNFGFHRYGATLEGDCVIIAPLPDYPVRLVETGQWTAGEGVLWSVAIPFAGYDAPHRAALASLSGQPTASAGGFDIYANGDALIYIKEACEESDTRGRFALSIFPIDQNDLPPSARAAGYDHEPLNFDFHRYGAILDDKCVIIRNLPNYPISHVQTGQWIPGEGGLWSVRLEVGD